jgi:hypothetical protein
MDLFGGIGLANPENRLLKVLCDIGLATNHLVASVFQLFLMSSSRIELPPRKHPPLQSPFGSADLVFAPDGSL